MPAPTGPQWSDFSPQDEYEPAGFEGMKDMAVDVAKTGARLARKGYQSATPAVQAATLATAAAGVLGAAGGMLPLDTGLVVAASSPALPYARRRVEHLASMKDNPDRMSVRRTLSPVRFVQNLMTPPGEPPVR